MNVFKSLAGFVGRVVKSQADLKRWAMGDEATGGGGAAGLSDPFRRSVWVQAAIKKVSGPISAVEWCMDQEAGSRQQGKKHGARSREQGKGEARWEEFKRRPAVGLTWADFIEASVGWLKLAGEVFYVLDDSWMVPFPEVGSRPLIVARPDRMREVVQQGVLLGWVYTDAGGKQHELLPEQVVQVKCWNPYDEVRGLSEWQAARVAAEADYAAGSFAGNLAKNNMDQGLIVVAKNGQLPDDQRAQIIAALRSKRANAQRGRFNPMFFAGDIEIQDPKVQAVDAAFVTQRLENRHEIFVAFGVPPSMADVTQSYSIGSASDRYALIEQTCIPTAAKIADGLQVVCERMKLSGEIEVEWDEHPVMQAVRRERVDTGIKLWNTGLSWLAVDEYLGLRLPEFPGKEKAYLPFSVQEVGEPANNANNANVGTDDGNTEDVKGEDVKGDGDGAVQEMVKCIKARSTEQGSKERPGLKRWEAEMAKRRGFLKMGYGKVTKVLMAARVQVLQNLDAWAAQNGGTKARVTKSAVGDLFSLDNFRTGLVQEMRGTLERVLQEAGQSVLREFERDDPFHFPPQKAVSFLQERENRISDCADEIHARVMGSITEGINNGETMAELAGRVKGSFNEIADGRAKTIAQTEVMMAYNVAAEEAQGQAGVKFKQWLTSGNANVRPSHQDANLQVVPIDQPFIVGGEALMHPCDPSGSAANVINCHCCSIGVRNEKGEI